MRDAEMDKTNEQAGQGHRRGRKPGRPLRGVARVLASLLLAASFAPGLADSARADAVSPALVLPDPAPAPPMTVLLPVPDERIAQAVTTLDELGREMLERTAIPGLAIAVVHGGRVIYAEGFGERVVGEAEPVDADTAFLLASLSKAVGATVVATQVTAGRVSWDSPVREFLPWFDMGDPWVSDHVTIADLYAHRSGLPDHAGDDLEDIGHDRRTVLERLALLPKGAFRADYAYTNFGLTAAAEAVATAANTDWASLSETALYDPLGMSATSSRHADFMARPNRAASHVRGTDGYRVSDRRQPDAQSPAGGVSSSANDMARWMLMVLGRGTLDGARLVSEDALGAMLSPQMITGAPMDIAARSAAYGFGVNVSTRPSGRVMLSHSGAFTLGASTSVAMIPDLDLGIVALTNAAPVGAAEAITASFLDRAELGRDTRDWLAAYAPLMAAISGPVGRLVGATPPADPAPSAPLAQYAGTYENAYFGAATVVDGQEGLVLTLGPSGTELPMQHWEADAFVVHPVTENQPEGSVSLVEFSAPGDDGATTLRIEHLDEEGLGLFQRR